METTVTSPNAGTVTITEGLPLPSIAGFQLFGEAVQITRAGGDAGNPLVLRFRVDQSVVPAGFTTTNGTVLRNGVQVLSCQGPGAVPDPCIESVAVFSDGDVEFVARTSTASTWALGIVMAGQTITFVAPGAGVVGGSATLSATGGASGNPVVFSVDASSGAGVCNVTGSNGSTVNYTAPGTCVIDANQAGNAAYAAAAQVQQSIAVSAPRTPTSTTITSDAPGPDRRRSDVHGAVVGHEGRPGHRDRHGHGRRRVRAARATRRSPPVNACSRRRASVPRP